MSEFHIRVVEIGEVTKHDNADSLLLTVIGGVGGYPVLFRNGEYAKGDRAVYVPVGAAVPADDPRWSFLVKPGSTKPYVEIEAKRLRGVFSMGILTAADPAWEVGRNVVNELRIVRVEDLEAGQSSTGGASDGEGVPDPGLMPCYTDIEGLRAHGGVLIDGEEVILTEKCHGMNARFALGDDGALHVGSRTRWVNASGNTAWATTARRIGLAERLARVPGIGVYGELYGNVNGMRYDATASENKLCLFDAMDLRSRRYLDYDDFVEVAAKMGLPTAPLLYRGPWSNDLRAMADGPSTLNAAHTREGFVVRPARERYSHIGRVVLKYVGERYLTKAWKL